MSKDLLNKYWEREYSAPVGEYNEFSPTAEQATQVQNKVNEINRRFNTKSPRSLLDKTPNKDYNKKIPKKDLQPMGIESVETPEPALDRYKKSWAEIEYEQMLAKVQVFQKGGQEAISEEDKNKWNNYYGTIENNPHVQPKVIIYEGI